MSLKDKVIEKTGLKKEKIPSSPQVIGHVVLAKFPNATIGEKKKIAKAWISILPNIKTVGEIKGIDGEYRQPRITLLATAEHTHKVRQSNPFETLNKEHGLVYKLDASKIMFSKGNHFERQRLINQVKPNETVIDMFAGIGYFSLGIAKQSKHVIAIEKNPLSFFYLTENIRLNKIKNITLVNKDCREVELEGVADRVLMGYFPHTEKFISYAKRFAKKGAIIHYHNIYKKDDLWKKPEKELRGMKILSENIIKSYAPNVLHVCIDAKVK